MATSAASTSPSRASTLGPQHLEAVEAVDAHHVGIVGGTFGGQMCNA
jgi:hypothetical protein